MGFEIDKSAEELKQKGTQVFYDGQTVFEQNTAPLTDAENQDLTYNLSGEAQTIGFTEKDADNLTNSLSGQTLPLVDSLTVTDETQNNPLKSVDEQTKNQLTSTKGLLFILQKYPNITKICLRAGIVTFLDQNGAVIKDENGNPLTIDYNGIKDPQKINLVAFYLEHVKGGEVDLNRMIQLQKLQEQAESTDNADEKYSNIQFEYEAQKLEIMSQKERKEYTVNKLLEMYNQDDFSFWINLLGEYYHKKCEAVDEQLKNEKAGTLSNICLPVIVSMLDDNLLDMLARLEDANLEKSARKELIQDFIQKLGSLLDDMAQDKSVSAAMSKESISKKLISTKHINVQLEAAIKEYLRKDLSEDSDNKMPSKTLINEDFIDISIKDFREKISNINSLEDIKAVQSLIEKMPYSKAEKQMLNNECLKQQGILQTDSKKMTVNDKKSEKSDTDIDAEHVKSAVAFDLFKQCKTPIQKELTNVILSDSRLYQEYGSQSAILINLLKNCKTKEDLKIRKTLIEKALQNPNLLENGSLNSNIIRSISNATVETYELQLKLFDMKEQTKNSDSKNCIENIANSLNKWSEMPLSSSKQELLEFSKKIIFDEQLFNNGTALDVLIRMLNKNNVREDSLRVAYNILKENPVQFSSEEICNASEACVNKDSIEEFISEFIRNGFDIEQCRTKEEQLLGVLLKRDAKLYQEFVSGRTCTKKDLYDLFKYSQYSFGPEILSNICPQQQYSSENIVDILKYTSEKTSEMTKQVLEKKDITVSEKVNVLYAINTNHSQISLIKTVLDKDDINIECLPKLLKAVKTLENRDVKTKYDDIDPKKVDEYIQLLQNPKTSQWVTAMLDEGWDIETISKLNPTKLKYYLSKKNKIFEEKDSNKKFFMSLGFNSEDSDKIIQAITKNGAVNTEMKQAAIELLGSGMPRHRIGEVLKSALITGEYNSRITADAVAISTLGLNVFLERYLPVANNLSQKELLMTFNASERKQLQRMIYQIPEVKMPALRAVGFDIDGILNKLGIKQSEKI